MLRTRRLLPLSATLLLVVLAAAFTGCTSKNKTIDNAGNIASQYTPTTIGAPTATPNATVSASETAAANAASAAASATPAWPGPAPKMTANITDITPKHGIQVNQASTRQDKNTQLGGVCAKISFADPVQSIQWFRMVLDTTEVTAKLTVLVSSDQKTGTICYATATGIPVGRHTAAVSVQDPSDTTGKILQIVGLGVRSRSVSAGVPSSEAETRVGTSRDENWAIAPPLPHGRERGPGGEGGPLRSTPAATARLSERPEWLTTNRPARSTIQSVPRPLRKRAPADTPTRTRSAVTLAGC